MPKMWGIDEDDGQLFVMGKYDDPSTMIDYGLLKWNDNGTIKTIGSDIEAMTLDENGMMYLALDSRRLTDNSMGATLLKFDIRNATTTGDNVVEIVGNIDIPFDYYRDNVTGLSIDPISKNLIAILNDYSSSGTNTIDKLYVLNKQSGGVVQYVGNITGSGTSAIRSEDLEHAPNGNLYITDRGSDETYRVNPATGSILEIVDNNQGDGLGISAIKFEALGWDFGNNRLIGYHDDDSSSSTNDLLGKLTIENGNNHRYYWTSNYGLTDVEGIDFVPTPDGEPLPDFGTYSD